MTQRVFVTGATGVLGRRVLPVLVAAGHGVSAVARTDAKADGVRAMGANAVRVDLFDRDALRGALAGHDVVLQLATNIPTGASAALRRSWRSNDALRRDAAPAIAAAALDAGVRRFVQESITFPYLDAGDRRIDEDTPRMYCWANQTTVDAENAAAEFTAAGSAGVVLRFAMFMAPDSAHTKTYVAMARRGIFGMFGAPTAYISFVHVDDAAAAVVAALDVPAGTYNVAEPDPTTRRAHGDALARLVERSRLRALPKSVERLGGPAAESLARSQRVSSQRLSEASGWRPHVNCVDSWKELT